MSNQTANHQTGDSPRETTQIPITYPESTLGAAAFIAVVAYPNHLGRRDDFLDAVKAWAIKGAKASGKDVPPSRFASIRNRSYIATWDKTHKLVWKRFDAIYASGLHPFIPGLLNGGTLVQAERVMQHQLRHNWAGHFIREIWSPSKPVLHLAIALRNFTLQADTHDTRPKQYFSIEWCLHHADQWLVQAISSAEVWRKALCQHQYFKRLRIQSANTIQLVPKSQTPASSAGD